MSRWDDENLFFLKINKFKKNEEIFSQFFTSCVIYKGKCFQDKSPAKLATYPENTTIKNGV